MAVRDNEFVIYSATLGETVNQLHAGLLPYNGDGFEVLEGTAITGDPDTAEMHFKLGNAPHKFKIKSWCSSGPTFYDTYQLMNLDGVTPLASLTKISSYNKYRKVRLIRGVESGILFVDNPNMGYMWTTDTSGKVWLILNDGKAYDPEGDVYFEIKPNILNTTELKTADNELLVLPAFLRGTPHLRKDIMLKNVFWCSTHGKASLTEFQNYIFTLGTNCFLQVK